tara:strand:- start:46 stop:585 length:540 start_codon:yes stop_codon:yes gene_type:complete
MSTLTVQNIQGSSSSSNTISVASGHKISGAAGSIVAPGQVIQMQNTQVPGTNDTSTSASYIDTGLSVNITPKFSTSKIVVIVHQVVSIDPGNTHTRIDFKCIEAGGTDIYVMLYHGYDGVSGPRIQRNMSGSGVFQCSNTNQLTFKTQIRKANGSQSLQFFPLWLSSSVHSIQALEIAQ